jgi:hypothetical protein
MISISDLNKIRAIIERGDLNLRERRAVQNMFSVLQRLAATTPTDQEGKVPPPLARFDAMTGIQKIRDLQASFNNCNESFLDPGNELEAFTIDDLVMLRRMWLASAYDFFPDQWAPRQVAEALQGKVPRWDPATENPIY